MARELGERLLSLARREQSSAFLLEAHLAIGTTLSWLGEFVFARAHLERGIALYDPQEHRSLAATYGSFDPRVSCLTFLSLNFLLLGYPDRALKKVHEALTFAQQLSHPHSQAIALGWTAFLQQYRRESQAAQERAEAAIRLSTEQDFPFWLAWGTIMWGGALAEQGQEEEGIAQMCQGLTAWQATGTEELRPYWLVLLAEACGKVRQVTEGLAVLTEALDIVHITGERFYEAELYRLRGELTLQQLKVESPKFKVEESSESGVQSSELEAERCFRRAIEVVRKQQAKSLELRASTSLARLWQQQGKRAEAHKLLSEVYNWFTEGFDTKDLQEAKALLDSLESQEV